MSRTATIAPCQLCGRMIYDGEVRDQPTWLNQFRILYAQKDTVAITGVGYYTDVSFNCWIAPPSYTARWDDTGYAWPASHQIGVLRQAPINQRWGFAFHESCWSLLEAALAPAAVPLRRLHHLCRSFPIPEGEYSPDWGHYYGGLDREHPDDGRCVEVGDESTVHHRLCVTQVTKVDPFHLAGIDELRVDAKAYKQSESRNPFTEVFAALPEQVCLDIASHLPTRDFGSVRLASRSFAPVFHSQKFWATRFKDDYERSWLFETQRWDSSTVDWRRVYRLTGAKHRSQAMHNRERVWLLALIVRKLLAPRFVNLQAHVPLATDPEEWHSAAVDVQEWNEADPYGYFTTGCVGLLNSDKILLPGAIKEMSFFVNWVGEVQYIVGIKIVGACDAVLELGYMAHEVVVDVSGRHLTGFYLGLTPTGIRAVQCVFDNGHHAPWVGSLVDASHTMKLVSCGQLCAVSARFDGCRIVSLSVASTEWEPATLRTTATWADSIPSREMHLCEPSFYRMFPDDSLYDPIHRSVFGGTRGQSLRYLTGIQVYLTSTPCGIEFEFTPGHLDYLDTCQDLGVFPDSDLARLQHFSVDGPGGECIIGVFMYVSRANGAHAELDSFKVVTNRGRSCHFQRHGGPRSIVEEVPVHVPPGATITGFYCTIIDDCMNALGVISEFLE